MRVFTSSAARCLPDFSAPQAPLRHRPSSRSEGDQGHPSPMSPLGQGTAEGVQRVRAQSGRDASFRLKDQWLRYNYAEKTFRTERQREGRPSGREIQLRRSSRTHRRTAGLNDHGHAGRLSLLALRKRSATSCVSSSRLSASMNSATSVPAYSLSVMSGLVLVVQSSRSILRRGMR